MPDFFLGKPLSHEDYPPDTEEKQQRLGAFFGGPANPQETAKKVPKLVKEIDEKCSGIQKWASLGMCWGGKVYDFFWVYMLEDGGLIVVTDCFPDCPTWH